MNEIERNALKLYLGETGHVLLSPVTQRARMVLLNLLKDELPPQDTRKLTIRKVLTAADHFIGWPSFEVADAHARDVRELLRRRSRLVEAEGVEVRLTLGGRYAVGIVEKSTRFFDPLMWIDANGDQRSV